MTLERTAPIFDGRLRPRGEPGLAEAFLPMTCPQNHAANLASLPGGDLGCVWFGGTLEGKADISIWFSRLASDADRWSEPVQLSSDPERSEQNPILFQQPGGPLWLIHTAQFSGNQDTAMVRRRLSHDGGATWGPVETLFAGAPGSGIFVRQPPLVTASGAWLLPVFDCPTPPDGGKWVGDADTSAVMRSTDQGRSWTRHSVPGSLGQVHMSIVTAPDGSLVALFRSRWADNIHLSRSHDDGATWSVPEATPLPNNNSSIQATNLAGGGIALVYNPSSAAQATARRASLYDELDDAGPPSPASRADDGSPRAFWGAPRAPLRLSWSHDGGRTWAQGIDLETGDGFCMTNNSLERLNRELSYPTVHQSADGALHVAFTYHRRSIEHVRIAPDALRMLTGAEA